MPLSSSTKRPHDVDALEAVEAFVAELERAQQQEDVDAFTSLFRTDAVWTTAHGMSLVGSDQITDLTRRVLPGALAESTARYDVTDVVLVRPDVAVVQVRQRPITLDADPLPNVPEGRPTYVLAREGGRWLLVAGQNTQVVG